MSHLLWSEASLQSSGDYSLESSNEAELSDVEENSVHKANDGTNHLNQTTIRHFPIFTISVLVATCNLPSHCSDLIALTTIIGLIYIICIHLYSPGGLRRMNIANQVSPDFSSWWMYTITPYPECDDVRSEGWRLLSNQFVHQGIPHIAGNSIALVLSGSLLEVYHPLHSFITIFIFESSMVMGNLSFSYFFPYNGIVGNSPGVYGLIGADVIIVVFFRDRLDHFTQIFGPIVLSIYLCLDVILYFTLYSSSTGYLSHCAGFLTGLSIMMISLISSLDRDKPTQSYCNRRSWKIFTSLIGGMLLIVMTVLLVDQYLNPHLPPKPFTNSSFLKNQRQECCEQLFIAFDRYSPEYSEEEIRKNAYCDDVSQRLYVHIGKTSPQR